MRIAAVGFVIVIIARMVYDLTFNPLEALCNIIGIGEVTKKTLIKNILKLIGPFVLFIIIWSSVMPRTLAYYNQPFQTNTHILSQIPYMSRDYIRLNRTMFGDRFYFLPKGENKLQETVLGINTEVKATTADQNTVTVVYQEPRVKEKRYFYMDSLTWPKNNKLISYIFEIEYY